jgi:DNA-binding winged helix-turn-helix (wHTH) protein
MKETFIINDMVVYDPEEHRLTPLGSRGKETTLNIPASRCLLLMLQRPGVKINQEEFFSEVWEKHEQSVTANTFYQNVSLIRKGLRNAGLRLPVIRTIPKIGLCFTGSVQVIDEEPSIGTAEIPVERSGDTEEVVVKHSPTKVGVFNRLGMPFSIKAIVVIIFFSFISYRYLIYPTLEVPQGATFFGEHMNIFTVNKCDVFINRHEQNLNKERFLKFLEEKQVSCGTNEFLYITNSPFTIRKIIMHCQASVDSSITCDTIYSFL